MLIIFFNVNLAFKHPLQFFGSSATRHIVIEWPPFVLANDYRGIGDRRLTGATGSFLLHHILIGWLYLLFGAHNAKKGENQKARRFS